MKIQGKEYKARFISVLILEKAVLITTKMDELQPKLLDPVSETEYKALWLQLCGLILDGDISTLDYALISAQDKADILSFFTQSVPSETQK
jgi:hypothetical protein